MAIILSWAFVGLFMIPCKYDAIKLSSDGYMEFSKLGRKKWT
jgi:hypothetical protein